MKYIAINILTTLLLFSVNSCQNRRPADAVVEKATDTIKPLFVLSLPSDTLASDIKAINGTIINNSSFEFSFGDDYKLEYKKDKQWAEVLLDETIVINSIAYILPPHSSRNFTSYLYHEYYKYPAGEYRILKNISTRFTLEFEVTDTLSANTIRKEKSPYEGREFELSVESDKIPIEADSIEFSFTNNADRDVCLLDFYWLQYYDEEKEYWLDYFTTSYNSLLFTKVPSGETFKFYVPVSSKKHYRYSKNIELYSGKYFLRPGKYRLVKDIRFDISKEFYLTNP